MTYHPFQPGQKTMAGSQSVTFASDQPALPLSTGAATAAKQDGMLTSLSNMGTLLTAIQQVLEGSLTVSDVIVSSSALPTGAATATKQDAQTALLTAIDEALGGTLAVSATVLPLPTGAATSANQTTIIGHIDGVETALSTINATLAGTLTASVNNAAGSGVYIRPGTGVNLDTNNVTVGSSALPTGAATAANQTTLIGHVDGIEAALSTINAALAGTLTTTVSNAAGSGVYIRPGTGVNLNTSNVTISSSALPTGAATDAKQDEQTALLTTIDAALAGTLPVSAASLPLPTGAATAANQSTLIGHVDGIEATLSTINAALAGTLTTTVSNAAGSGVYIRPGTGVNLDTNNVTVGSSALPTGAATATKQDSQTALLTSIDDALAGTVAVSAASLPLPTGAATSANQTTIIGHIDGLETLLTTISAALAGTLTTTVSNAAGSGVYIRPGTGVNLDTNNVTVGSSALPTGAATAANQSTIIGHVDGIEGALTTLNNMVSLPTAPVSGQASVTTAAAIASSTALKSGVTVKADPDNSANVFVGPSGVSSSNGFLLAANDQVFIETDNLADVFAIAASGTQKLYFIGS